MIEHTGPRGWLCRCECGNTKILKSGNLRMGTTLSCGCLKTEERRARYRTHGETGTTEHLAWKRMRVRCNNKNSIGYEFYGGRGIKVCDRWGSFENFLADMGRKPSPQHSIDRIDVNGHYEPSNCRWATRKEQMNNTRANRRVAFMGRTQTVAQWAEELQIPDRRLTARLLTIGIAIAEALIRRSEQKETCECH